MRHFYGAKMEPHIPEAVGNRQFGGVRRRGAQRASAIMALLDAMLREVVRRMPTTQEERRAIANSTEVPTSAVHV